MSLFDRFLRSEAPPQIELTLRGREKVVATRVPRELAWEEWQRRRARGVRPLLIGQEAPEAEPEETRPSVVLREAAGLDLNQALAERLADAAFEDDVQYDFDLADLRPGPLREAEFHALREDPVWIAELPGEAAWQIPAYLPFGDWNDCPGDALHCAVLRVWQERYRAELAAVTDSSLELWVPEPLTDKAEAKRLAQQQAAYCADIVAQGTGTVRMLAQELLGARTWFFWWD